MCESTRGFESLPLRQKNKRSFFDRLFFWCSRSVPNTAPQVPGSHMRLAHICVARSTEHKLQQSGTLATELPPSSIPLPLPQTEQSLYKGRFFDRLFFWYSRSVTNTAPQVPGSHMRLAHICVARSTRHKLQQSGTLATELSPSNIPLPLCYNNKSHIFMRHNYFHHSQAKRLTIF